MSRNSPIVNATIIIAACVVIIAGMRTAAEIIVPIMLAVFIAIILTPWYRGMVMRKVPAVVAIGLLILLVIIIGLIGALIIGQSVNQFINALPGYEDQLRSRLDTVNQWLRDQGVKSPRDTIFGTFNPERLLGIGRDFALSLTRLLNDALYVIFIVVFILLEVTIIPAKVRAITGLSEEGFRRVMSIADQVNRYLKLKTLMSLLTGFIVGLMLYFTGVDYPVLLGLIAFLLNYIPAIGSLIAGIPGVLLAYIQFGPGAAIGITIGYFVINNVISNVIEPRIMGRNMGMSPVVVMISLIFWGWVLGPVGMLLAVPLTMVVKIAVESDPETRWLGLLMDSRLIDENEKHEKESTKEQGNEDSKATHNDSNNEAPMNSDAPS